MKARRSINLSVARSCFVRCSGCYNHFGKHATLASSDEILAFLRYAYERGIRKVTLCGGDPLARPDILDLLVRIRAVGLTINLDTVGTPLLGSVATIFMGSMPVHAVDAQRLGALVDLIGIPLDGSSNDVVARFRAGRANLFAEIIDALSALDRARAAICVNTVVHRSNYEDVPRIARILRAYPSIRKWQLFQFSPNGPLGYRNRDVFVITDEQFEETRQSVTSACARERYEGTVEFKSNRDRHYLLVDSEGIAHLCDLAASSPLQTVVGDIRQAHDHPRIVSLALEPARAPSAASARPLTTKEDAHVQYVDVSKLSELPPPAPGTRHLDFIGGEKELRCFSVPFSLSRNVFMEAHSELLDEALRPIYASDAITVRQDASYALAGFYIVGLRAPVASLDRLPVDLHLRMSLVLYEVRAAMRSVLGIDLVHLHYEERPQASCSVHYWLMPLLPERCGRPFVITHLNVLAYVSQFRFSESRDTIYDYNGRMREHMRGIGLYEREQALAEARSVPVRL